MRPEQAIDAARRPDTWLYYRGDSRDEAWNTIAVLAVVKGNKVEADCILTLKRGARWNPKYPLTLSRKEARVKPRTAVDLRTSGSGYVISRHVMRAKR